mmetsp:Transcript_12934/g.35226  ORF Transcript_12934/g.35226 Transcript_12934/m.35226 type:complete len:225 (-) Transcript_12934:115-789(-)
MHAQLGRRCCWLARSPSLVHKVLLCQRHHMLARLPHPFAQPPRHIHSVHIRVDAHASRFWQVCRQPVFNIRAARGSSAHECPLLAQLLRCLQEVPPIRPQQRLIRQDHSSARGAREPGNPLPALEAIWGVLAHVGILSGYDECMHPSSLVSCSHVLPDSGQTLTWRSSSFLCFHAALGTRTSVQASKTPSAVCYNARLSLTVPAVEKARSRALGTGELKGYRPG